MYFRKGQGVVLLPFEDQPQEHATVLGRSGSSTYVVQLHEHTPPDDGLREVTEDQIRLFSIADDPELLADFRAALRHIGAVMDKPAWKRPNGRVRYAHATCSTAANVKLLGWLFGLRPQQLRTRPHLDIPEHLVPELLLAGVRQVPSRTVSAVARAAARS